MVKPLKNRKWRVLSSEYLLREGAWCTVRRDSVELPNGKVIPNWYEDKGVSTSTLSSKNSSVTLKVYVFHSLVFVKLKDILA